MLKNKILPIVLMVPVFAFAQERQWKSFSSSANKIKMVVDLSSIQVNKQTSEVTYWIQNTDEAALNDAGSQIIQMRVNCKKNSVAFIQWISYQNKNWQGKITHQAPFRNQAAGVASKPLTDQPVFAYLCSK